jgi:hypothetical protein
LESELDKKIKDDWTWIFSEESEDLFERAVELRNQDYVRTLGKVLTLRASDICGARNDVPARGSFKPLKLLLILLDRSHALNLFRTAPPLCDHSTKEIFPGFSFDTTNGATYLSRLDLTWRRNWALAFEVVQSILRREPVLADLEQKEVHVKPKQFIKQCSRWFPGRVVPVDDTQDLDTQ